jgi:hypothetical protein
VPGDVAVEGPDARVVGLPGVGVREAGQAQRRELHRCRRLAIKCGGRGA